MSRRGALLLLVAAALGGCVIHEPEIKSMYLGSGTPMARPDSAQIEVFLRSDPPARAYSTLGEVEINCVQPGQSLEQMLNLARLEARKMGGDALIVETGSNETMRRTVPVRNLYTGQVMFYKNRSSTRESIKGAVIAWAPE